MFSIHYLFKYYIIQNFSKSGVILLLSKEKYSNDNFYQLEKLGGGKLIEKKK